MIPFLPNCIVTSSKTSIDEFPSVVILSSPERNFCLEAEHAWKTTESDKLYIFWKGMVLLIGWPSQGAWKY